MDNWAFSEKPIDNNIKKQNITFRIIKLVIWIIIIISIFIYFSYKNFTTNNIIYEDKIVSIKSWDIINDLADKLDINKTYLKIYLKNNKPDFELITWDFNITKKSTINNVLESLKDPIIYDEVNIVFLEGWNIYDIDNYLTDLWYIEKKSYINYVTNTEKVEALSEFFPFIKWLETLEGFLYPDTYKINIKETQINQIVITQLENFESKVLNKYLINENWEQKYTNEEIEKIVNLASIVEKEEKNPNNKAIIAWILKKRLDEWWMIWADATVCYPHKLTWDECKMVVSKYIKEISNYNTRTMAWLPKTPIWNPSSDTINATINYKKTPYYFYLHNTATWEIYFATTNAEHEANKKFMK